ncbi:MAG: hypothetical protein ACRC6I_12835 [Paracoccaceae bacterium]
MTKREGLASAASGFDVIGATLRYTIGSYSNGLAYLITERQTGIEHLLTGEAAFLFHKELQFMQKARAIAGSPVAARPWTESLDELVENFWRSASAQDEDGRETPSSDKI